MYKNQHQAMGIISVVSWYMTLTFAYLRACYAVNEKKGMDEFTPERQNHIKRYDREIGESKHSR